MRKKSLSLVALITLITIFLSACSTKKDTAKVESYPTESYSALSKADKKKVDITLMARPDTKKVIFDLQIKNSTRKAVEFDPNEFELNTTDVSSISRKKFAVKPKNTKTIKKLFIAADVQNFKEVPELSYEGNKVSIAKLKIDNPKLSKILLNANTQAETKKSENSTQSQNNQQSSKSNTEEYKNMNTVTDADWTPGVPQEIIGQYVSEHVPGVSYQYDLTFEPGKMILVPRAPTDSFGLDQIKYVKLAEREYMLKGQALIYTTFYLRVIVRDNGGIITAMSQSTPTNFGDDIVYYRV